MLPQKLLRIAAYDIFNRAQKAPRVLLDCGLGVGALAKLDALLDHDTMGAVGRLTHDKYGHDQRLGALYHARQGARGRCRLAEKGHKDRLSALGVLIERHADQLSVPKGLKHRA